MKPRQYSRIIIHQFDPEAPSPGGTDTCIRDMLKFIPEGERVLVIGVSQNRRLNRTVKIATFPTPFDFLPVSRVTPRKQARVLPHSLRVLVGLIRALLTHRLRGQVVQIHRLEPGLLAGWMRPQRVIYFVHTNIKQALSSHSDSFWRRWPGLYRRLEARVLSVSDLLVVFNEITAQSYIARGENVERMRTWYNESIYYPIESGTLDTLNRRTLVWVGRIEAPKDPLFAVEVFRAIYVQSGGVWKMSVVGHGTMRAQMEQRVHDLGLEDAVSFHGAVSREEVGEQMRDSDVLLMTSHFEGSPRVLYESMGSGVPVVATWEADPDRVVVEGSSGFVLNQRDPEAFASAIAEASRLRRADVLRSVSSRQASSVLARLWHITSTKEGS